MILCLCLGCEREDAVSPRDQQFADAVIMAWARQSNDYEREIAPQLAAATTPEERERAFAAWKRSFEGLIADVEGVNAEGVTPSLVTRRDESVEASRAVWQAVSELRKLVARGSTPTRREHVARNELILRASASQERFELEAQRLGLRLIVRGIHPYLGDRSAREYHRYDCPRAMWIAYKDQAWFTTAAEARAAGYRPCTVCKP